MDVGIIAFFAIFFGALCGFIIPTILKMREEEIEFETSYLWGLVLSTIVATIAAAPSEIDVTFRGLSLLFLAGVGLQGIVNKGNTMRLKHKK